MAAVIAIVGSSLKWTIVIACPTTAKATSVMMVAWVVSRIQVCSSSLPLICCPAFSPHLCPIATSLLWSAQTCLGSTRKPSLCLTIPSTKSRTMAATILPPLTACHCIDLMTRQQLQSQHASPNSNGNQDNNDKAITMATKTGLMGAVKAMAMVGTVTGAMAGTAVQMAGSSEDINRNGSGNCNGVLSVASSL
ncbi:hypothetical protein EDB83DRAFT_2652292 [Lactarius deliciosus]|nr:hypothetical protein EDB83DRAFT_2652292 [Lactarius deliciosus]